MPPRRRLPSSYGSEGRTTVAPAAAPPPPPPPGRPLPPNAPPLVVAPAGFRLPTPAEVATGPALVGRTVLYYWPGDGWVRGTVVRHSRPLGFSGTALGRRWVLDASSHGPAGRCVLLCPTR